MLPFKIFPGMLASAKIFFTASCATVDVATPLQHATKIFTSFAIIFILQIFLCWLYFDSLLIHELTYAIIIYLTKKSFKPSFRLSIFLKMC